MAEDNSQELNRLRKAIHFLTSHLPGASELAELAEQETVSLSINRAEDAEEHLLVETGNEKLKSEQKRSQAALDAFKEKHLSNLEVGRLYERYIGYLYEGDDWAVNFKGIIEGFNDLGRDLICIKGDQHRIVQAKCWSKHKEIHEKHVYQLHASALHYRMSLRKTLKAAGKRKSEIKEFMRSINIKSVVCTTNDLSETADEVVKFLGDQMEHKQVALSKDYPMIKCNVGKTDKRKLYHLPFDPQYDSIIIGNMDGEQYVETVQEAEELGFKKVGT